MKKREKIQSHLIFKKHNKYSITSKKAIILYCIFVGILGFIKKLSLILYTIICLDDQINLSVFNCAVPFETIFQFICSYFILKMHFYKPQQFSLFINLGIFIILLIIDLVNIFSGNPSDGKIYCFYIIEIFSYSFEFSLGKKILLFGFLSIYSLIIIKGFIGLILSLLFSLIMFFVKIDIFSKIKIYLIDTKCIWLLIAKNFLIFLCVYLHG